MDLVHPDWALLDIGLRKFPAANDPDTNYPHLKAHARGGQELILLSVLTCVMCRVFRQIWPALGPLSQFSLEPNAPHIYDVMSLRKAL